jgi:hypothetical protein
MTQETLDRLRSCVSFAQDLFGPEGDSGESCTFVNITDLRELLAAYEKDLES